MGIENMRRWPLYVVFSVCILLSFQLFNSWGIESDLRYRIGELSQQLHDCSKQHSGCMEESLALEELKANLVKKLEFSEKRINVLTGQSQDNKIKVSEAESKVNRTVVDLELCKVELQSLKNLQLSKTATLETLRLEKETLTAQLEDRKKKILALEAEVEKLKLTTNKNNSSSPSVSQKVTPEQALAAPKVSPEMNMNNPINEPVLEDNAKEELEDAIANEDVNENMINNNDDFDPQIH